MQSRCLDSKYKIFKILRCGTNIYFFTLQRFGPSPSLNFKKLLKLGQSRDFGIVPEAHGVSWDHGTVPDAWDIPGTLGLSQRPRVFYFQSNYSTKNQTFLKWGPWVFGTVPKAWDCSGTYKLSQRPRVPTLWEFLSQPIRNKNLKHAGLWVFETVPSQKPRIPGSLPDPRSLGQSGVFGNVAEARDSSKFKVDTCCRPKLAS